MTARNRMFLMVAAALLVVALASWGIIAALRGSAAAATPEAVLGEGTRVGVVALEVQDLERMREYYTEVIGLEVIEEAEDRAVLGFEEPVVTLIGGESGSAFASPEEAGLYHSAILYPTEAALARVVMRLAQQAPDSFQGSADHAVSLAFYAVDPEGNGVELYVDRPADAWEWTDGEVQMGSAPLDPNAFVAEHLDPAAGTGADEGAMMGHVHLKVGDLEEAEAFYVDGLGFAVTARSDGALFYAADGYHHHLATNIWQSSGAGERTNPTGLSEFTVLVPDARELTALAQRLDAVGAVHERDGDALVATDPWGNDVRIEVAP